MKINNDTRSAQSVRCQACIFQSMLTEQFCLDDRLPADGTHCSWVGASSVNEINILNITHILTILSASEIDQYGPEETKGVELRHLCLADEPSEDIIQYFKQECDWLDKTLKGGVVLVHCQQGISRSVAVVVAYCGLPHRRQRRASH